jgi:hypothetical protein
MPSEPTTTGDNTQTDIFTLQAVALIGAIEKALQPSRSDCCRMPVINVRGEDVCLWCERYCTAA